MFLIKWGDLFTVVPGSCAATLRKDPSLENVLRHASRIWQGSMPECEFLKVLRNPRGEYERAGQSAAE